MKPSFLIFALIAVIWAPTSVSAQSTSTFQPAQLQYLGAFRLPRGNSDQTSFNYGGIGVAFNPTNNSLYITGHPNYGLTAELSIPSNLVQSSTPSNLPIAGLIQPLADATAGKLRSICPACGNPPNVFGELVYNNSLITTGVIPYDGSGQSTASHFTSGLAIGQNVQGAYRVGTDQVGAVDGYMALVPSSLQAALGGPAVTGQCCGNISIISRTSVGATIFSFDPASLGNVNPVPATPLIYYPYGGPVPWPGGTVPPGSFPIDAAFDPVLQPFNIVTRIAGVFFDESSQSAIFPGEQGMGTICYKYPPCDNSNGYGVVGGVRVTGLWVYSMADIIKVKNGQMQAWQPVPTWHEFDLPIPGNPYVGGVAFDPATKRAYIAQLYADNSYGPYSAGPIIHVYQLTPLQSAVASIAQQPQDATLSVGAGESLSFYVGATGTALKYQWQREDAGASSFVNISGATQSTYTAAASEDMDEALFRCVVSNSFSSVTSSTAALHFPGVTGTMAGSDLGLDYTYNRNGMQGHFHLTVPRAGLPLGSKVKIIRADQLANSAVRYKHTGMGLHIITWGLEPSAAAQMSLDTLSGVDTGKTLTLAYYDTGSGGWQAVPTTSSGGQWVASLSHFSTYALMQASPADDLSSAKVYPNPFRPAQGHTTVTFANLPASTRIRIYTLAGEKVKELSADSLGAAVWDARNDGGAQAASGVYFAVLEGNGQKKILNVAVQR